MKHAYCIMAHAHPHVLAELVRRLDDKANDIYIHIDSKSEKKLITQGIYPPRYSNLYILEKSFDVRWGGYSQIKAEMLLYKTAMESGEYDYFHLMSGQDLPIKSIEDINIFFEKNRGYEFIGFYKRKQEEFADRVMYYYLFQDCGLTYSYPKICSHLNALSLIIQKKLHIRRNVHQSLKKGPNWCTLTKEAVHYLLSKQNYIRHHFKFGFCADEIYKQTIIWNSQLKQNIYNQSLSPEGNLYLTLWDEGKAHPRVFNKADKEALLNTPMLYARKFDESSLIVLSKTIKV